MATTSRKGTAIHVRLSRPEAERIRAACATAIRAGRVKTMNEWQKNALMLACDSQITVLAGVAAALEEPAG